MVTLPQSLPRSFRDLDFSFREGTFKTALAANFRGVDIPTIFLDVLPWSHEEIPQNFFAGVAWSVLWAFVGGQEILPLFLVVLAGGSETHTIYIQISSYTNGKYM